MELRQYLYTLRRHIILIVACVLVAAGIAYTTTARTKIYTAKAVLFIGQNALAPAANTGQVYSDPLIAAQYQAVTYAHMVPTVRTAQLALSNSGLLRSPEGLAGATSSAVESGTTLIDVTVADTDPVIAGASLADAMANAFVTEVKQLQPDQASSNAPLATVFQKAAVPGVPRPSTLRKNLELFAFIGLLVGTLVAVLLEYLDLTIKGASDAQRHLELPVLAAVPARASA